MRTLQRIGIGLLVGLFFTAGYASRQVITAREQLATAEHGRVLSPATRIAAANLQGAGDINFQPIQTLYVVVQNLREQYVEQLTPKDEGLMTYDALRAMLASLNDQHTRFVDPEQRKLITDAQEGKFHGIGAMLGYKKVASGSISEEHLTVITPIPSGPAAHAGLKSGDDIIEVNGKNVLPVDPFQRASQYLKDNRSGKTNRSQLRKLLQSEQDRIDNGIPISEARNILMSEDKESVELTIMRKGDAKPFKVKLKPEAFSVSPVDSSLINNGEFGYIKINCLSKGVDTQFASAVEEFKSKGADGLVIDLRNCASGDFDLALKIAGQLAPAKKFAVLEKSRGRREIVKIPGKVKAWSKPIVVLVNSGTARTTEVLASALRDNAGAKLVGEKTYGDSSYISLIEQKDGSCILMTNGKLLTSSGVDFTAKGIAVDTAVSSKGEGDAQLKSAVKLLSGEANRS